jgi:hypothetical protein
LRLIESSEPAGPARVELPTALVIRESTGPAATWAAKAPAAITRAV